MNFTNDHSERKCRWIRNIITVDTPIYLVTLSTIEIVMYDFLPSTKYSEIILFFNVGVQCCFKQP